jgi:hypothetical protein
VRRVHSLPSLTDWSWREESEQSASSPFLDQSVPEGSNQVVFIYIFMFSLFLDQMVLEGTVAMGVS